MKRLLVILFLFVSTNAYAATYTAAAGGGDWNNVATWGGGGYPQYLDTANLDATSGNVTVNVASVCSNINCTGYTGTLTLDNDLMIRYGDATFVNTMTLVPNTRTFTMERPTANLTTGGLVFYDVNLSPGSGSAHYTVTLQDDLSCHSLLINTGSSWSMTLACGEHNVTLTGNFSATGGGLITHSGSQTFIFNGISTIDVSSTKWTNFNNFTINAGASVSLTDGQTLYVAGTFTAEGTSDNHITLDTTGGATASFCPVTIGTVTYVDATDINSSGLCPNLNGADESFSIANEGNFDFEYTNAFSIEAWVYEDTSDSNGHIIFSKLVSSGNYEGFEFRSLSNKLQLTLINDTSPVYRITVSANAAFGLGGATGWHHVACSYDGSGVASGVILYVDGSPVADTDDVDTLGGRSILNNITPHIGSRNNSWAFFDGKVCEVVVYNKVLSPAEVAASYNAGAGTYHTDTTNVVGGWHMVNETTVADWSGASNTATAINAPIANGVSLVLIGPPITTVGGSVTDCVNWVYEAPPAPPVAAGGTILKNCTLRNCVIR